MFELADPGPIPARYNVAPTDRIPALRRVKKDDHEVRQLSFLRWGLIPFWAKDPSEGARMINARAEGAADKLAGKP